MINHKKLQFKNDINIGNQSLISGSDVKKLKAKLLTLYKGLKGEDVDLLVVKNKEVGQVKLSNKTIVYSHQSDPILFETDKFLYPSLYSLWKLPSGFLPDVRIHNAVFKYINGGADLMLGGIINPDIIPKEKNQLVAIHLQDSHYSVALGFTIQDKAKPDPSLGGKVISIIHMIDDRLYNYGTKLIPSDFLTKKIESLSLNDENQEVQQETTTTTTATESSETSNTTSNTTTTTTTTTTCCSDTETTPEISAENMDKLIYLSFLGAIKKGIKDKDLPMVLKTVFNKYMIYYTPIGNSIIEGVDTEGIEINIKKSSYKKVLGFLREMEKKNIIEIKEPSTGNFVLNRIFRNHPEYIQFKVQEKVRGDIESALQKQQAEMEGNEQLENEAFGSAEEQFTPIIKINEVYSIPKSLLPICNQEKYLPFPKIQTYLLAYIQEKKLDRKESIQMDQFLQSVIIGKQKSGTGDANQVLLKSQFFITLKTKLKSKLELVREGYVEYVNVQSIKIECKKVAGNKRIIEVSNLKNFSIPIKEMCHDTMKSFSVSTSIKEKLGQDILRIQGNQTSRVSEYIQQKYKIPSKFISIHDK